MNEGKKSSGAQESTLHNRVLVGFRLQSGDLFELEPGDIIGRLWSCTLFINDPNVSEAHAMVSLREGTLKLVSLRGRFAVDGVVRTSAELRVGMTIQLTQEIELTVETLSLPASVLAIEGEGLGRHILTGVSSLRLQPKPEMLPGTTPQADASFWNSGFEWRIRKKDESDSNSLLAGDEIPFGEWTLRVIKVETSELEEGVTKVDGALATPLTITANFDSVHIHTATISPLILSGVQARIVSELVAFDGPVAWDTLAREVWGENCDRTQLRRNLDVNLSRLRKRLREARIRPDLVRADRTGQYELYLHGRDEVLDRT